MSEATKKEMSPPENEKLEAIKQIIFGQNMVQYDKEFADIREYINFNLAAIDKEIGLVKKAMADSEKKILDLMEKNQQQLLAEIAKTNEAKADRRVLGKLLMEIGQKISA